MQWLDWLKKIQSMSITPGNGNSIDQKSLFIPASSITMVLAKKTLLF